MPQSKCPYDVCDGSGLLPFTGKDGKVRQDVHLYCDCHPVYGRDSSYNDCYSPLKPADIDFPCSYSYWRSLCQYHGWKDPGNDYPPEPQEEKLQERVIIHRHSNMGKLEYDLLQQTSRQVKYLLGKVDELTKHRQAKYKPAGYKGLK